MFHIILLLAQFCQIDSWMWEAATSQLHQHALNTYIRGRRSDTTMFFELAAALLPKERRDNSLEFARFEELAGDCYSRTRDLQKSHACAAHALRVFAKHLARDDPELLQALESVVIDRMAYGSYSECVDALRFLEATRAKDTDEVRLALQYGPTVWRLGHCLYKLGELEEARKTLLKASELNRVNFVDLNVLLDLASCSAAQGKDEQAKAYFGRAIELCKQRYSSEVHLQMECLTRAAEYFLDKDAPRSDKYLAKVRELLSTRPAHCERQSVAYFRIRALLEAKQEKPIAEDWFLDSISFSETSLGDLHFETTRCLNDYHDYLISRGRSKEALVIMGRIKKCHEAVIGELRISDSAVAAFSRPK